LSHIKASIRLACFFAASPRMPDAQAERCSPAPIDRIKDL
jgi:hypothetical protein